VNLQQAQDRLASLDEVEGVAVRVGHRCDAGAATDVLRLTGGDGAGLLYLGERGVEVGDTDVGHRCGQALLVTIGVEPDLDTPHIEPDVEGLVGVGLGAEKGGVDSLGGVEVAARAARAESRRVVDAFLAAARGGDLATLLLLLAPHAVMRADLVGQRTGADPVYDGAAAVAARFNGAKGAVPVTIDGDLGGAWILAGKVKVAFAFYVDVGLVQEIELIADPDVLATMDVVWRGVLRS